MRALVVVPWFLWSIIYPPYGTPYRDDSIRAAPVHEYKTQQECESAAKAYRAEIEKAFPSTGRPVSLICSPVNPKP